MLRPFVLLTMVRIHTCVMLSILKVVIVYLIGSLVLGVVYSWGDGDYGKLGRGGSDGCKVPKIIDQLQGLDVVRVFCGVQFSAALTKMGAVYTW